jgi:hypothetical protein
MKVFHSELLRSEFNCNPPTAEAEIQRFQENAEIHLPDDYLRFLQYSNGGEGFIGNAYVILWRLEELLHLNQGYKVEEFAPGLFLFGSDGGGEAFAFDMRSDSMELVSVPFIPLDLAYTRRLGSNFGEFLDFISKS